MNGEKGFSTESLEIGWSLESENPYSTFWYYKFFFIPSNLGTQEGVFVLAVNVLKESTSLGLAVAVIRRLREVIWISIGLMLGFNQNIDFKKLKKKL